MYTKYLEQKEAGLATLVVTGTKEEPTITIVKKNWNPDTGEQIEDTFTEIKLADLEKEKIELNERIEKIDSFLETAKVETSKVVKEELTN